MKMPRNTLIIANDAMVSRLGVTTGAGMTTRVQRCRKGSCSECLWVDADAEPLV